MIRSKPKPEKKGKKKRKSVRKVSPRGVLVKKAHALMRDIVLERDQHCVCPPPEKGHSAVRQAGHIIKSTKGGCRWSLWNVHEQCSSCNGRHEMDWTIYQKWFMLEFSPVSWIDLLEEKKNIGLKNYELEEIIVQFQAIIEQQKLHPEWKPYFTQAEILSGAWRL